MTILDPTEKKTIILIEKYKAFYKRAMKEHEETSLSIDEVKAIGKRVINEVLETAFINLDIPNEARVDFIKEFEQLLHKECPDMLFETSLKFDEQGFSQEP